MRRTDSALVGLVSAVHSWNGVQMIAIRIGGICGAVGGQAVLLEPSVGNGRASTLIFVGTDVHRAADGAWVAAEVGGGCDVGVVARIDAVGVGLEAQITACKVVGDGVAEVGASVDARGAATEAEVASGRVDEGRFVGDVPHTVGGHGRGAGVVDEAVQLKRLILEKIGSDRGRAVIDNAVVEGAGTRP